MKKKYPLRKFVAPEFVFGIEAHKLTGQYAHNLGAQKIMVVTDPGVINAGWTQSILESLENYKIEYVVYSDVSPNPRGFQVLAGAELFQTHQCDAIVAVGGGSPMDCAKGIGIVHTNQQHIFDFEGVDEVKIPAPPLICIPTTAGSSADVSQFAIINNSEEKVKIAIISKKVVPDVSLIDPMTTITMDAYLTACTGIDALTHAIEAYVSNANSAITDLNALESIRLIKNFLLLSINNPKNLEYRSQVMLASLYAGLAFSNASLGAVHAMSHSLGGLLDSAHGECNAILLDHVIDFNYDAVPDRYKNIAKAFGLEVKEDQFSDTKYQLIESIQNFKQLTGITNTLSELGISRDHLSNLAKNAYIDPCIVTNPKNISIQEIEKIYEAAL